jgi:hypothetical protein
MRSRYRLIVVREEDGSSGLDWSSLWALGATLPGSVVFADFVSEAYPLRIMLRSTALFGFILTGIGTLLPWFRWEMVIGGQEAIFEESAVDMADKGETIFVFAVVGGTVVWLATRATPLVIPVLTAAMSLVVVLYTHDRPPLPVDHIDTLQGFYVTLAGTVIALAASTTHFLESFRLFPSSRAGERIGPGR